MDSLKQIEKDIRACQKCQLREGASAPVPGLGEIGAEYFLIGEAPGPEEDKNGVIFCGYSGRKLDELVSLGEIDMNKCYLSTAVRCLLPVVNGKRRDPKKVEIRTCSGFVWRELQLVKPRYVVTLGSVPLSLFTDLGVRALHGTMLDIEVPDNPAELAVGQLVRPVVKEGKCK